MDNILKDVKQSWLPILEANKFIDIYNGLDKTKTIYPLPEHILESFRYTEIKDVKVVLLGQDPYINEENGIPQACGLSFSVPESVKVPPSLRNLYLERKSDLGIPTSISGDISRWASEEGILLLNSALTVEANKSGSHMKQWLTLTDNIIKEISDKNNGCVFILLGNFAKSKKKLIDGYKHGIVEGAHPSPLSASRFFGSKIYSKTNDWLIKKGLEPVNWNN